MSAGPGEPPTVGRRDRGSLRRTRVAIATVLVALTVVGLVVSTAAFWARSVIFEEDRWISTVRTLPEQHDVAIALGDYLTEQLFVAVDFEERLGDALPDDVAVVVPLLSSAIHGFVAQEAAVFVESDRFQRLWVAANRQAHRALLAILDDQSLVPGLERTDDTVTLDLVPVVNALLDEISDVAGGVVGTDLALPEISDDESTQASIRRLGARLGIDLPDDFGQITVYRGDQLPQPRDTVVLIERVRVLVAIATVILAALALAVAPGRRRATLGLLAGATVGFALLLAVPDVLGRAIGGLVDDGQSRAAAEAAVRVVFESYETLYRWLLATAVLAGAVVVLTGPGRLARRARSELGRSTRRFPWSEALGVLLQRWLAWLRVGGAGLATLYVLAFTRRSLTAWFVLFALVVAYEALLSVVPDAPPVRALRAGGDGDSDPDTPARPQA